MLSGWYIVRSSSTFTLHIMYSVNVQRDSLLTHVVSSHVNVEELCSKEFPAHVVSLTRQSQSDINNSSCNSSTRGKVSIDICEEIMWASRKSF